MNAPHQHLVLNHLPLAGLLFGFFTFLLSWLRQREDAVRAALWLLIVGGVLGVAAYVTGRTAATERGMTVEPVRAQVRLHAQAGFFGLVATVVTAAVAAGALVLTRKRGKIPRGYGFFLLIVNLWALGVIARVSYLGALISHPEIVRGTK